MEPMDIGTYHRLADQLEQTAKNMKQHVNSPDELERHLNRINDISGSLQSHMDALKHK